MSTYRALQVFKLSTDFRAVTKIVKIPKLPVAKPGHVVVRNHYLGINAIDINITNGHFGNHELPFTCGLEAVGAITAVGNDVENFKVGDAVAYQHHGAFAEYVLVPAAAALKVPAPEPAMLPLMVGGVSCSIALEQAGQMKSGETVLVTSAAGGTGQFVVQLAKMAGNHVIGTCSTDEKAEHLKKLGCDRLIVTSKESIDAVLKAEYPNGVDLVFETVGGETFKTAVENIAVRGRIIVFGYISEYKPEGNDASQPFSVSELNVKLLMRSASVRGFGLGGYLSFIPEHLTRLLNYVQEGKLIPGIDQTPYHGLEEVADAVERMFARKNLGKLVVKLV
ncbi:hypothetical protein Poli38472_004378 [Pythium oligandrum]|uniref:Enoyl reductase (ER) domain-containing protein n=1 Tax=Pythium oligandrum TaxID=41045 RepID=A0A8K1FFT3_PYTOL|nr:hypothetical protein Poli38472_004378 [Pythium oligandrum]|eukprot:TMW59309.1 hypothetical protein Poli38472_004378 [Pythium oligandrum]